MSLAGETDGVTPPTDPLDASQVEHFVRQLLDAQRGQRTAQVYDLLGPRTKDLITALNGGDVEAAGRHAVRLSALLDDLRADVA